MALLLHGSSDARRAVVTAMRLVATGDLTRPFEGDEADVVRSLAEVLAVASGDEPVDLSELVGVAEPFATVEEATSAVRSWLPDRADRRAAIHTALLVALVADEPDPAALHAARRLARALGADDHVVKDLERLTTRHAHAAEADLFRRFLSWKTGEHLATVRRRLDRYEPVVVTPPERVVRVRQRIDAAAPDTVGHAIGEFYEPTGYDLPGTPGVLPLEVLGSHDVHHVLAAYDASAEDEVYLALFTAANARSGGVDYMAVVLLQWHQGIKVGVFDPERAVLDPHLLAAAAQRGSDTPVDLTRTDWDWESLIDVPLDEARATLGIPPGGSVAPGGHWDAAHHQRAR